SIGGNPTSTLSPALLFSRGKVNRSNVKSFLQTFRTFRQVRWNVYHSGAAHSPEIPKFPLERGYKLFSTKPTGALVRSVKEPECRDPAMRNSAVLRCVNEKFSLGKRASLSPLLPARWAWESSALQSQKESSSVRSAR